jgi:S-adenosylmethionine-diacylglycerol 3-amino-3-carboxypropyl transferase
MNTAPQRWRLRYGQCWEDADRLVEGLAPLAGRRVLSIASGGENTLALLAEGPERLVAIDRNPAQLAALELKAASCACLAHGDWLVLLGAWERPEGPGAGGLPDGAVGRHRQRLYAACRDRLSPAAAAFWDRQPAVLAAGLLHGGRFERYLAAFRRWLLPLLRHPQGWPALLAGQSEAERHAWVEDCRRDWRWRLLFRLFFSRAALGGFGTDPRQVRYGAIPQGELVLERLEHVLTSLDPRDNPYLHWILLGRYGSCLPRALRPESQERIRRHLGRLELRPVSLEDWLAEASAGPFDRFNLSNVFEYASPQATTALLGGLHGRAAPGARLLCWNRLAERDTRLAPAGTWAPSAELEEALHRRDRVFFYRRLVLAEAIMGRAPCAAGAHDRGELPSFRAR